MKRVIAAFMVAFFAVFTVVPAQAAKPFAGTYKVTLLPDPSPNAYSLLDQKGCKNLNPGSVNKKDITVPTAGRLTVTLKTDDVTGHGDWDLFVLNKDGEILSESTSETGNEETVTKFKRKTAITIAVCNLNGGPEGTVSYKLTK